MSSLSKSMLLILLIIFLFGCESSVDSVKESTLADHREKTIGDAFDNFFDNPQWSIIMRPANIKSSRFDYWNEFHGKLKKDVCIDSNFNIPRNSIVVFRFSDNKKNNYYEINNVYILNPNLFKLKFMEITNYQDLSKFELRNKEQIDKFLNTIYGLPENYNKCSLTTGEGDSGRGGPANQLGE